MLDRSEEFDLRFIARARKFSIAAGIFVMLVGAVVLCGWLLNINQLKTISGGIAMKANAAFLLVLSGASLCLLNSDRKRNALHTAAQVLAAIVMIVAVLTLSEHLVGWNLGIDQLLFTEAAGALATASPGRMGPPASTCFTLIGFSLLLLHRRRAIRLRQILSILVCLWALLAIMGYVYNAAELFQVARYTGIALPTAVALLVLGIGLLAARLNEGITTAISSADEGGSTARRLLGVVVIGPFLLGWLLLVGQQMGFYDFGFGTALLILSIITIFTIAVWRSAAKLSEVQTAKIAAEKEVRQREEGLRRQATLIELSYEPVFVWQLDDGILEWNKGCEQLYGYDRAEVVGKSSHQLLKTEFLDASDDVVGILRREGNWTGVLRHLTRDGREVTVESRQQVIESDGKQLVLETNRDITEQFGAEESRQRLAAIVASSNDAIVGKTLAGVITSWNDGAERIFGYTESEVIGQSVTILIPPDRQDEEPAIIQRLRNGERVDHFETVRVRKDGQKIDLSLTISPIRNALGQIIGASKVARDITESKRSEARRRESERMHRLLAQLGDVAARASESSTVIETVMEHVAREMEVSRCGYSQVDVQAGQIVVKHDYSGDLPSLVGSFQLADYAEHIKHDGLVGRTNVVEDLALAPDTAEIYETNLKPIAVRAQVNVPLLRDGQWVANFWVSHHEPRTWSPADVELIQIIADRVWLMVERKQAEEERERLLAKEKAAREQAETANRVKDEFLATVSHELRTPLNAILGWASMLLSGKIKETDSRRALETIERNARSQAQLIEDILDVSRSISGKLRLDIQPIEMISVIRAAVDSVGPAAEGKGIQLQLLLDPAADHIQADPARMQQVVWNLLSNAIKFTPKDGKVQLKLDRSDTKIKITVTDTGEGVEAEFLPYVFNRFHQADGSTTRRHGGLGLGLAIARHLVEMHGGTIEAASKGLGQGATFTVAVPIAPVRVSRSLPALDSLAATGEKERAAQVVPTLNGLRVLAIDDEADVREMLRTLLEGCGADVLTASSAKEGLDSLTGWKPHVVISDIGMPDEDGFTFIRKMRALSCEQGSDTPAIALTGYVRVEDRMRALEAGYQMFVPKPVEVAELATIISNLIGPIER